MSEEIFDLVNESGKVIGQAPRSECHGNPELIHQVVHILVRDEAGRLFLQKRALNKDIQPGKWDTSVGGHFRPGEEPIGAARREMLEELGVEPANLIFAYKYLWRSPVETELVRTFTTVHGGPFALQREEIDEGRFWSFEEIEANLGEGIFTPNFEVEFKKLANWLRSSARESTG
ncbi:MAG: NUDIX domain-containing protein [Verrucomicrobia bacterium]|nr:NUDIX domain-containing protein [Verrucomicrobiota bacterium]